MHSTICRLRTPLLVHLLLLALLSASAPSIAKQPAAEHHDQYRLRFSVDLTHGTGTAKARIAVKQHARLLREVRFRAPAGIYSEFSGDGTIRRKGAVVIWQPPAGGGHIEYDVLIDHQRANGGFDALLTDKWTVFRGDDVFPPALIIQRVGATSSSEFSARIPDDWSIVTPYATKKDGRILINNPERKFDRPVGWLIAGRLGVRRDLIAGIEVSVAGPVGSGVQRISMLALLRWTLPLLTTEIERVPPRISIVSAGEPMWHGGLSAPNSLFIQADRPLLSENATSTLLHEVIHVLMPISTDNQHDWIDEGIAEYVTLEILRRSGTISGKRFNASIKKFAFRGKDVDNLLTTRSTGAVTARAVTIFHDVDNELQKLTEGRVDIFELIRRLMAIDKPVNLAVLKTVTADLTGGRPLTALKNLQIP